MAQRAPGQALSAGPRRRDVLGAAIGLVLAGCRGRRPDVPGDMSEGTRGRGDMSEGTGDYSALRGLCDGAVAIAPAEHGERQARAQAALRAAGLHALIAEAGATLLYFTGVSWHRSERPLLWVLPAEGAPTFIGPAFETHTLRERIGAAALQVWSEHASPYAPVGAALAGATRVAVEPWTRMFVLEGLRRALPAVSLVDGGPVVRACRTVKSPAELALLRRANEATKAALRAAAGRVRAGMLEAELAAEVRAAQAAAGLDDAWALVLFGANAAFPHGTRGERRLAAGELVLVDCGGALHDYHSDITRTWPFGQVDDAARRAWTTVLAAQTAALAQIRPGQPCGAADAAARAVIVAAGYGPDDRFFTHRLGHGIGLETHEDPYLVRDAPTLLVPGMTMSNEPGIYVPGALGVRLEDIVAVTASGAEVFGPRAVSLEAPFGE